MDVLYGMILKRFSLATTKRRDYGDVLIGQILYIILKKALTEESLFPFMYGNGYLWTRLRSSTGAVQISIASQKKKECGSQNTRISHAPKACFNVQVRNFKEATGFQELHTSQIHRKSLGQLALRECKGGEELFCMSID